MFRKWIYVTAILFLLSACNQENTSSEKSNSNVDENSVESEKETIILPETDEEWLAFSEESKWFEKQDLEDVTYAKPIVVDFEGDSIPEVVIPYSPTRDFFEKHHGYLIGNYNSETMEWELWQNYELAIDHIPTIEAIGKLKLADQTEILITEELQAGATKVSPKISMYRISTTEKQVILAATHMANSENSREVDAEKNTLRFVDEGKSFEFRPEDNRWLVSDAKRLYLKNASHFFHEDFLSIIGENKITSSSTQLEDSYEDTKKRLGDPLDEGYWEGAICAYYTDYYFCKSESSDEIIVITLAVSNNIKIQDFENFLGSPDDEGEIIFNGEFYTWTYYFGDIVLNIEATTLDPDSTIENIKLTKYYDYMDSD